MTPRSVVRGGEFRRIEALPRRSWEPVDDDLVRLMTEYLRRPGGTMSLRPVQAAALAEAHDLGGGFFPIGVGCGKALISLLAPVVMEAERPVLFVPADLREQTLRYVVPEMSKHWTLHPNLRVVGYSELSLLKNRSMLEEIRPDLIVLDECHMVKSTKAGRTRRLKRYLRASPTTRVVAMSGTVCSKSLKDYAHISAWALGAGSPVPSEYRTLIEWSGAIDDVRPEERILPGALGPDPRGWFRSRLVETPGVVATGEDQLGTSLRVRPVMFPTPDEVEDTLKSLRYAWEDPNGDPIAEATDLARKAKEISLGFWYKWDPAPPDDWIAARKAWMRYVRANIRHHDTELGVANASKDLAVWKDWKAQRAAFEINVRPIWLSMFAVTEAARWLSKGPGICWVDHVAFGEMLSRSSGFPYFGAGDDRILEAEGPVIASIRSHGQGKNLQRWSRNLIVSPPSSGKTWEQVVGRTHRLGQSSDEVIVDVFAHQPEMVASVVAAKRSAEYLEETLGSRQKLNYADFVSAFDETASGP